jgi:prepilin signal peptidase PulO-like enzyme (type II secretory pathway)
LINIFNYPFVNQNINNGTLEFFIISIFFLSIGSFISTVIVRLSKIGQFKISDLMYPPSRCTICENPISFLNLIPLIGYLKQCGKCINCKNKISIFYPITEFLFLIFGTLIIFNYGFSIYSIYLFLIFTIFYILFVLDIKYFYLPLPLNLCISGLGLTGNVFFSLAIEDTSYIFNISPLFLSILGFVIGYSFLYLINFFI